MLISAFVFGGIPKKAVEKAFAESRMYVSQTLLNEYRNVPLALKSEGKIDHLQLKALISGIAAFVSKSEIIYPTHKLAVCRDPKDDMLLECCFEAGVNFLITGDKDLLELGNIPFSLKIITPRQYIKDI